MEISVFHGRRPILLKMCTAVKSWIRLVPIHGLLRRCAYQWVYVTSPETNYDWRTPYAQTSLWPRHAYGPWSHCLSATKPPVECSYRFCNLHSALGKARIHAAILCRHPSLSDMCEGLCRDHQYLLFFGSSHYFDRQNCRFFPLPSLPLCRYTVRHE